jgi:oligopeptide transport system ATP-binding protein
LPDSPVVAAAHLRKVYRHSRGKAEHVAVADLSFTLAAGASLGIVGESGAGKSTVAKLLMGMETPSAGSIRIAGSVRAGGRASRSEQRRRAREIQMVFQDPYTSLDPRQPIGSAIDEVLRLHFELPAQARRERVGELLAMVGLVERHARALPGALSGGQRQRVAIARALAAQPAALILDESVSALDVSIQAQILNLLADLRASTGIAYLLISHDLAVVRHVTDQTIVMRRGEVIEQGSTSSVLDAPQHPYTQTLRASVPGPGWTPRRSRPQRSML